MNRHILTNHDCVVALIVTVTSIRPIPRLNGSYTVFQRLAICVRLLWALSMDRATYSDLDCSKGRRLLCRVRATYQIRTQSCAMHRPRDPYSSTTMSASKAVGIDLGTTYSWAFYLPFGVCTCLLTLILNPVALVYGKTIAFRSSQTIRVTAPLHRMSPSRKVGA
jgi:hypothetical protein